VGRHSISGPIFGSGGAHEERAKRLRETPWQDGSSPATFCGAEAYKHSK
jgi:hypothetical protein